MNVEVLLCKQVSVAYNKYGVQAYTPQALTYIKRRNDCIVTLQLSSFRCWGESAARKFKNAKPSTCYGLLLADYEPLYGPDPL